MAEANLNMKFEKIRETYRLEIKRELEIIQPDIIVYGNNLSLLKTDGENYRMMIHGIICWHFGYIGA